MKRLLVLVALAFFVAGCKSRGETVDPFFGRTTVEPPATGTLNGRSIDPYYRPTSASPGAAQPAKAAPATTSPKSVTPQSSAPATPSSSGVVNQPTTMPATGTRYLQPVPSTNSGYSSGAPRTNTSFTSSPWSERVPPETLSLPRRTDSPPTTPGAPNALPSATPSPAATTPNSSSGGPSSPTATPVPTATPSKTPPTTSTSAAPAVAPVPIELRPVTGADTTTDAATSLANRPRIARTLDPRPATDTPTSGGVRPATYIPGATSSGTTPATSPRSVNINDLPSPKTQTSPSPAPNGTSSNDIRPLGEVVESDGSEVRAALAVESAAAKPDPQSARGKYGFEEGYGVLRGKLEYSQAERRWKLRYIPIDGEMDAFGGSVVLSGEKALAGLERGQLVEVRGKLNRQDQPQRGFAPLYEVTEVNQLTAQ